MYDNILNCSLNYFWKGLLGMSENFFHNKTFKISKIPRNCDISCVSLLSCSVLSNSLQSFGLQPARLLSPWDSPGKNIGVGCHALLQGIFPTHRESPGLWQCRRLLHPLSYQGGPGRLGESFEADFGREITLRSFQDSLDALRTLFNVKPFLAWMERCSQ